MNQVGPGSTRVGWIGAGVMGCAMAGHLLKKGYALSVTTRTKSKAAPVLEAGAKWSATPREVAENADVVVAIVGFPAEVREVFLGSDGAIHGARAGSVLIDMSTSNPSLAREIDDAAQARQAHSIDAPVSGGDVGARNATLSIMIGGEESAVEAVRPILECLGKTIVHQGPAGSGQHTKMVNQILIATNMIGVCEALLYSFKAGLNPERVLQSVGGGAAASWSLNNLGPRMLKGDFEPGFFVEHFLKDMAIALDESRRMGLSLPGLALSEQLYRSVQAHGLGRKGTQALMLALADLSNVEWKTI